MRWMAILLLASPAYAEQITCFHGGEEVTILLHDRIVFGREFDCIRGTFLGHDLPCAPNGAFSLYSPTGQFQGITVGGTSYLSHQGSVIGHYIDAAAIAFTGGYGGADGYRQTWRFFVDRASWQGQLVQSDRSAIYRCYR